MITIEQSNYLHSKMREMEEDVKAVLGLDIHFGVYLRSKAVSRLMDYRQAVEIMCKAMQCSLQELSSKSRSTDLVIRRKVIASVLRATYPNISLSTIGELFERDHTTIINLLSGATNMQNINDEEFMKLFNIAKSSLDHDQSNLHEA